MKFRKAEVQEIIGTSYQGLIKARYSELCQIFGQPLKGSNDGKIQAQWRLVVAGLVPITIYDYKDDTPPREQLLWHIGGKSKDAVQLIEIVLKEQRKLNK